MVQGYRRSTLHPVHARLLAAVALVLSLVVTACGGSSATVAPATPAATPPAATTAPAATTVPVATAAAPANTVVAASAPAASAGSGPTKLTGSPVPLVIYAAHDAAQPMADAFTAATGIPTKLVADSTGPLLAKIQAEKNNPQWGMLWIDGAEAMAALDGQGQLLTGYYPDVALTDLGKSIVPQNKSFIPTGLTITGALVYDTRTLPNPPTSWQDLLKPEYKDMVGMNNPAVSGPTYPFVAGQMQNLGGVDQGKEYFKKLKANGLHVYTTNKVTLNALGTGEIKMAVVQSSAALGAASKTPTLKVIYLPKVSLLPSNIGIDAKAPGQVQTEAKIFAEFVLSPQGQQIMKEASPTGDSLYYPIVSGATPLASLPPLASIPTQIVAPYVWGARVNEINQWFTENIA